MVFFHRLTSLSLVVTVILICMPTICESGGKVVEKKYEENKDHLKNRARWEWTLSDGGKEIDKGTFMGYTDGRICHGKEQKNIGTWKKTGINTIVATFDYHRLEGSWNFVQTRAKPPTFEGKLKAGTKKIHLEIVND